MSFENVSKRYGDVVAASNLNLCVRSGEFLSFLGPSGCGKTTMLRMIAGFEQPSEGSVYLNNKLVNGVPAYKRPVNMVFQDYALFPHLNIADNVAYGLKQRQKNSSKQQIYAKVTEALALVQLPGYEKRRIWEMSGGQQQRVALARALINQPEVLLLDEPLAALDRKLRREMQIELQNLQRNVGITFILVTHDQEEALSMSDRVCIMREGEIVQTGTPRELYDQPLNRYIADFVGKSNFFDGIVEAKNANKIQIKLNNGMIVSAKVNNPDQDYKTGHHICISIRPEQLLLSRLKDQFNAESGIEIRATVRNRIFLGEHTEYLLHNDSFGEFLALTPRQSERSQPPFAVDDNIYIGWSEDALMALEDN